MRKRISDGSEHGAHVLFTQLIRCEREGSVFYVGARSNNYQRAGAMTLDYTRELVAKLSALLADHDRELGITVPAIDDIALSPCGDLIHFELRTEGKSVGAGAVTRAVAMKAKGFLDQTFPPEGNVVRIRGKG